MSTRVARVRRKAGGKPSVRPKVLRPERSLNASRAALLFGTALGVSLAVFAASAPTTALAADECGANAAGVDSRTCAPGLYAGGIEYTGGDDLTVVLPESTTVLDGVRMEGTGDQALDARDQTTIVDTGGGTAVEVISTDGSATVTVDDVVATGGAGVIASGYEGASVTVNGAVVATDAPGVLVSAVDGDAVFANNGSVTATGLADGVVVQSQNGAAVVTNTGTVTSESGGGVIAYTEYGAVSVTNGGTITADGVGVDAQTGEEGPVSVTNTGTIVAGGSGVFAYSFDEGAVTVTNSGTITSGGTGIDAQAWYSGDTSVTNTGTINAAETGIYAYAWEDNVAVTNDGAIVVANTAGDAIGIDVYAAGDEDDLLPPEFEFTAAGVNGSDITVAHNGTLSVTATGAATGIQVEATAGHAAVEGAGSIDVSTSGQTAVGVDVIGSETDAGATIVLTGDITVSQTAVYGDGPYAGTPGYMWYDYQAVGVQATNVNGPLNIQVGDIHATGYVAQGVAVLGANPTSPIDISFDDITVQSGGGGGHGVFVYAAAGGAVSVSGDTITATGDYSDGVNIGGLNGIVGDVTVAVNAISTDGFNADGVHVDAHGDAAGDVTVTTGSITVAGENSSGIEINAVGGDITVTSGAISVADGFGMDLQGDGDITVASTGALTASQTGIVAASNGGNVTVANGGVLTASGTGIDASATGEGAVSVVNNGSVVVAGAGTQTGVDVSTDTGSLSVTGTGSIDVASTGQLAVGIDASGAAPGTVDGGVTIAMSGDITVSQTAMYGDDPLAGTPGHMWYDFQAVGVQVGWVDGPVSIEVGDIDAEGYVAQGIAVLATNPAHALDISFADINVVSHGGGGHGVFAYGAAGGAVSITGDSITTSGDYSDGVNVGGAGGVAGDVTIDVGSISTDGYNADGVHVAGHGDVHVTTGAITVAGLNSSAIEIATTGGDITVTSGDITVADGLGMDLSSDTGDIVVTTTGDLTGVSTGIRAQTGGDSVTVTNNGAIVVDGDGYSVGVEAQAVNGHVTVAGTGSITVGTTDTTAVGISVAGDMGSAVDTGVTVSMTGPIVVSQDAVFGPTSVLPEWYYQAVGVQAAWIDGPVDIAVGDVSVTGHTAQGIVVLTNDPLQPIDVSFDDITVASNGGGGHGVMVYGAAGGAVSVSGDTIVTTGVYSDGVNIGGSGDLAGDVTVDARSIVTNSDFADGVDVGSVGSVDIAVGQIETFGDEAHGVTASSSADAIDLTFTGKVTTHGAGSHGVTAVTDAGPLILALGGIGPMAAPSGADVTIVSTGDVVTSGDGSHGVFGFSALGNVSVTGSGRASGVGSNGVHAEAGGDASVTVNGATSSVDGYGVLASAGDAASVTVNSGATVSGDEAGVFVQSTLGATILNNGRISGLDGVAIDVDGAAATVTNASTGTIVGGVDLTDEDDVFVNAGTFQADADSDFGLGDDTFTNTGTVKVNGVVAFTGLETFDNRGNVDLRDGAVGDVLDLGGATFNGLAGSTLSADVNLGAGASDTLVVGDLTGVTNVVLNNVGGLPGVLGQTFNLVESASDETGAELVMADNFDVGFIEYGLTFNAATDTWGLVGLASEESFQPVKAGQAAQSFARRSADAWSAQMQAGRDGRREEGVQSWVQVFGGSDKFDSVQTFSASTERQDLTTESNWRGVQAGLDTVVGGALLGVTVGYGDQETEFEASANGLEFSGWNLGAYASWNSGGLFVNGLAKVDMYDVDADLGTAGANASFEGRTWGLEGEVGYRFGEATFVEPVVGLSWSNTDLDGFTAAGASFQFDDVTSLQGRIGARVGGSFELLGSAATPWVGVYAVNEFAGENRMRFNTGASGFTVTDEPTGSYGKLDFGVSGLMFGPLETFVQGEADFGGDASGMTARIGARWKW